MRRAGMPLPAYFIYYADYVDAPQPRAGETHDVILPWRLSPSYTFLSRPEDDVFLYLCLRGAML